MTSKGTAITNQIDLVRLRVGDTDAADPLLTNNEITTCVFAWPDNPALQAAQAAEQIAAKLGREYDFSTDGQSFSRSQGPNFYLNLAAQLRSRGAILAMPGGTAGTAVPDWTPAGGTIN
jgi:hypothetical protein